jgi:uncharacterized protein
MYPLTETNANKTNVPGFAIFQSEPLIVEELKAEQEAEVLEFLGERASHTFGMAGFIRTNGLVSQHNRGTFYGCRDEFGRLQGVALIGHYILFESRTDSAIETFARLAQDCRTAHMMLGEQDKVEIFWHYYADNGQSLRLFSREILVEQSWPIEVREYVPGLRLATPEDLELIVPAHAELAFQESGINPLEADAEGFRRRCARRIEQGKTWVWVEDGRLIFKADVITDTAEVVYLEGVWVDPSDRGQGNGLRCLSQLSGELLTKTQSLCLLVNEKLDAAQRFYKKAGFKVSGYYDTIYLNQEKPC